MLNIPQQQILVYGNCQALWIAQQLMERANSFNTVYLSSIPGEVAPEEHPIHDDKFLAACSYIILQSDCTRVMPEAISNLPKHARVIRFPAIYLKHLWPLAAHDPRNQPTPEFRYGPHPYGDRLVIKLLKSGLSIDALVTRYFETNINTIVNIEQYTNISLKEMQINDKNSDFAMTPRIDNLFRTQHVFGTFNHPTLGLLEHILHKILHEIDNQIVPKTLLTATETYGNTEIPLHPQIIEHFNIQWVTHNHRWRFNSEYLNAEEYIRAYAAFRPIPKLPWLSWRKT